MDVKTETRVRPFFGRVAVLESPVDEHQKASGLILPWNEDDEHLRRGVIVATEERGDGYSDVLQPGTVIWYSHGKRVLDVTMVDYENVYGYEEPE